MEAMTDAVTSTKPYKAKTTATCPGCNKKTFVEVVCFPHRKSCKSKDSIYNKLQVAECLECKHKWDIGGHEPSGPLEYLDEKRLIMLFINKMPSGSYGEIGQLANELCAQVYETLKEPDFNFDILEVAIAYMMVSSLLLRNMEGSEDWNEGFHTIFNFVEKATSIATKYHPKSD